MKPKKTRRNRMAKIGLERRGEETETSVREGDWMSLNLLGHDSQLSFQREQLNNEQTRVQVELSVAYYALLVLSYLLPLHSFISSISLHLSLLLREVSNSNFRLSWLCSDSKSKETCSIKASLAKFYQSIPFSKCCSSTHSLNFGFFGENFSPWKSFGAKAIFESPL